MYIHSEPIIYYMCHTKKRQLITVNGNGSEGCEFTESSEQMCTVGGNFVARITKLVHQH